MTSEGGRRRDAGAKTVTDDSPLKVAVIKAKEALMKCICNSTRLEIPRRVASNTTCSPLRDCCGCTEAEPGQSKMLRLNLSATSRYYTVLEVIPQKKKEEMQDHLRHILRDEAFPLKVRLYSLSNFTPIKHFTALIAR